MIRVAFFQLCTADAPKEINNRQIKTTVEKEKGGTKKERNKQMNTQQETRVRWQSTLPGLIARRI
jgi:hypothetical protein